MFSCHNVNVFVNVPCLHFGQANSIEAARVQWNVHQRTRVVPQQPRFRSSGAKPMAMGYGRIIIATHIELTPPPQVTGHKTAERYKRYVNDSS